MHKKTLIFQRFLIFFVLSLFFFVNSCSFSSKNERFECKWSPDYEKIGESALENKENLSETELKSAQMSCKF